METIKRQCNVIMLPTNEKARIGEITSNLTMPYLFIMDDRVFKAWNTSYHNNIIDSYHLIGNNLYFTSDEEIKEGDYYYSFTADAWFKQGRLSFTNPNERLCKKIISSTDTSLGLPQPSPAFIKKYISEYNKGNIIEKIMVEYFKIHVGWEPDYSFEDEGIEGSKETYQFIPKVSKDNTITISKVKDSWDRNEVIEFAERYVRMVQDKEIQLNAYKAIHNQNRINKNL